jgi:hypothetical protein
MTVTGHGFYSGSSCELKECEWMSFKCGNVLLDGSATLALQTFICRAVGTLFFVLVDSSSVDSTVCVWGLLKR